MDNIILKSFFPEVFLSFSILLQLVFNIRIINKVNFNFPILTKEIYIQTLFILICLVSLYFKVEITGNLLNLVLVNDKSIFMVKILLTIVSIGLTVVIKNSLLLQKLNFSEYYSIYLLGLFSLLIMLSCESLVSFYVAMEMQALCFYVLASFNRTSVFSTEAGLKYFISGSFMSGFYLLGASIIYGCLGTLDLSNINILLFFSLQENNFLINNALILAFLLIIFVLLFKLACAPFHFWSPDVYDGAPLSSTIIFSILPKLPIFYFFVKLLIITQIFSEYFNQILLLFGLLSTLLGTLFALKQKRVKRLVIYSSIAQMGFMVSVLSVLTISGISSLYFFLIIYLFTSLLIWGHIVMLNKSSIVISNFNQQSIKPLYITSFNNFFNINTVWCVSILLAFFSIAGIPPLIGFLSKMLIIFQLIDVQQIFVASLLILISAVSVYYYIRLIKITYFESNKFLKTSSAQVVFFDEGFEYILFAILLFSLIFFFFFPTQLLLICEYVSINLHLI
jgi:NADH-quinone oxidoreductase subunit N